MKVFERFFYSSVSALHHFNNSLNEKRTHTFSEAIFVLAASNNFRMKLPPNVSKTKGEKKHQIKYRPRP